MHIDSLVRAPRAFARRISRGLEQGGPAYVLELAARKAYETVAQLSPAAIRARHNSRTFDAEHGNIDTATRVSLADLNLPGESWKFGVNYQPSSPRMVQQLLDSLPIEPRDYAFMDVGSGKGRVLLAALERGFRQVIGVELAPELHHIAQENLRAYGDRVELRCQDATAIDFPAGPTVVYLFNPFTGPVAKQFFTNLNRSVLENPRDVWVVYNEPAEAAMLAGCSGFKQVVRTADSVLYRARKGRVPTAARASRERLS